LSGNKEILEEYENFELAKEGISKI